MTKSLLLWLKQKNNYPKILFGIFLLIIGYLLYANLGRDALFDWDEGIYAELGRQVVITKNFLVTFWNGSPWLEKPPGIAWASAIGILIAGPSSYGARLLMPLFAVYVLYVIYRIGTHLGSWKHGIIAAGVLASLNLFLGRTRAVNTDMALLASISTTILFLLENRPAWWVALSIFGGVWFKGIAGLLSVFIAIPLIITKNTKYLINLIIACVILILPWHIYVYLKYGQAFLTPYFFEQVVQRATAQIEFHFETRWYYFNYLYTNLGIGVLLVSLYGAISALYRTSTNSKNKMLYLTLLWWVLSPLAIFTLAKTRLFWYILPIYPGLALLISEGIGSFQSTTKARQIVAILAVGVLLQGILSASRSVELTKVSAPLPDRLYVVESLSKISQKDLAVLVPPSERLSEALLPQVARLSSSFRYGGMPSIVFYYRGHVNFFYDVDLFRDYWMSNDSPLALIAVDDKSFIPGSYNEVVTTPTYLGIQKGVYALR